MYKCARLQKRVVQSSGQVDFTEIWVFATKISLNWDENFPEGIY